MILLNSVLASTGPTPIVSSVVNGASYIMAPLPSNSYAALFGSNLATNDQTVIVSVADQLGNQSSPTVLYAGTEQVNVLVPAGPAFGHGNLTGHQPFRNVQAVPDHVRGGLAGFVHC